jgi:hypothetical protein
LFKKPLIDGAKQAGELSLFFGRGTAFPKSVVLRRSRLQSLQKKRINRAMAGGALATVLSLGDDR